MIDNPRFRGMTLPQAREIEKASRGFRDLSDEQVWALRKVHAHDCTQRPAELPAEHEVASTIEQLEEVHLTTDDDDRAFVILAGITLLRRLFRALAERPAEPEQDDEEVRSWAELADEFAGTAEQSLEDSRKQERETGRADLFALGRSEGRSEAAARIRHLIPRLAERPAEPDREAAVSGPSWTEQDVDRLAAVMWFAAEDIRSSGPTTADGQEWERLRRDRPTYVAKWHEYARHALAALAERPVEPDADLVAAMYDALQDAIRARRDLPRHQKHRYSDIEAMAAVAQDRIYADRARILGELRKLLNDEPESHAYATGIRNAIAVVDEGGQR